MEIYSRLDESDALSGQPKARTINISIEFSALKRIMPLGTLMPIQQSLTVTLPTCDINSPISSNIFAHTDLPTIAGISDEAEILSSLQKPKKNMTDGLGITGYEGIYLRVCEITLSVLRSHKEPLMSVLETSIHDPLVEWTKSHKSSGVEVQNPHAQERQHRIWRICKERKTNRKSKSKGS